MKKLRLILTAFLLLSVVACSSASEKPAFVCSTVNTEANVFANKDVVSKFEIVQTVDHSAEKDFDEATKKKELETEIKNNVKVDGVSYSFTIENKVVTKTTTFDTKDIDVSKWKNIALPEGTIKVGDDKKAFVSKQALQDLFKQLGYTCK